MKKKKVILWQMINLQICCKIHFVLFLISGLTDTHRTFCGAIKNIHQIYFVFLWHLTFELLSLSCKFLPSNR